MILDIYSKGAYPGCALSNFAEHPFVLDGIEVECMEGLLHPPECQQTVCKTPAGWLSCFPAGWGGSAQAKDLPDG